MEAKPRLFRRRLLPVNSPGKTSRAALRGWKNAGACAGSVPSSGFRRRLPGRHADARRPATTAQQHAGLQRGRREAFLQFIYDAANTLEITPHDLSRSRAGLQSTRWRATARASLMDRFNSSTYVATAVEKDPQTFADDVAFMNFLFPSTMTSRLSSLRRRGMGICSSTKYPGNLQGSVC